MSDNDDHRVDDTLKDDDGGSNFHVTVFDERL